MKTYRIKYRYTRANAAWMLEREFESKGKGVDADDAGRRFWSKMDGAVPGEIAIASVEEAVI